MMNVFRVRAGEVAVASKGGVPSQFLPPGTHRLWFADSALNTFRTDEVAFVADESVRNLIPRDLYAEIDVGLRQRAVFWLEGRPVRSAGPGVHRYWTLGGSVRAELLSLDDDPPTEPLVRDVLPTGEILDVLVDANERGILRMQGKVQGVLDAGLHLFWNTKDRPVAVRKISLRRSLLAISGQELLTKDRVTLRVSLTLEWSVVDPVKYDQSAEDASAILYAAAQLALRDYVAGATLEALLEDRQQMTAYLTGHVVPEGEPLGIQVARIGVKDIILPGEMKTLLNRVIEAETQAAAEAILRREASARTRTQANTAQLMAERPILLRLKELETLSEMAGQVQELRLVVGADRLEGILSALPKSS